MIQNHKEISITARLSSMLNTMNKIDLEELGYILPKPIPSINRHSYDDPKDLHAFGEWYRKYIISHRENGTVDSIRFSLS